MPNPKLKLVSTATPKTTKKQTDLSKEMCPEVLLAQEVSSYNIDVSEILHLTGGSAANGDNSDPIVARGNSEIELRALIAKYGFSRMPLTFGEFHGLLDYCDKLNIAYGLPSTPPDVRARWQPYSIEVVCEAHPEMTEAIILYCKGDTARLLKLHEENDTLTQLGKTFQQYESQ